MEGSRRWGSLYTKTKRCGVFVLSAEKKGGRPAGSKNP